MQKIRGLGSSTRGRPVLVCGVHAPMRTEAEYRRARGLAVAQRESGMLIKVTSREQARELTQGQKLGHATLNELTDKSHKRIIYDFSPVTRKQGDYRIARKG